MTYFYLIVPKHLALYPQTEGHTAALAWQVSRSKLSFHPGKLPPGFAKDYARDCQSLVRNKVTGKSIPDVDVSELTHRVGPSGQLLRFREWELSEGLCAILVVVSEPMMVTLWDHIQGAISRIQRICVASGEAGWELLDPTSLSGNDYVSVHFQPKPPLSHMPEIVVESPPSSPKSSSRQSLLPPSYQASSPLRATAWAQCKSVCKWCTTLSEHQMKVHQACCDIFAGCCGIVVGGLLANSQALGHHTSTNIGTGALGVIKGLSDVRKGYLGLCAAMTAKAKKDAEKAGETEKANKKQQRSIDGDAVRGLAYRGHLAKRAAVNQGTAGARELPLVEGTDSGGLT